MRIVLEQQVSLASGRAAFERLVQLVGTADPERIARLDPERLAAAGLTRQKARYIHLIARAVTSGALDLDAVSRMSDASARETLLALVGVGPWTADIYLLMALRRPDIWPSRDLAIAIATREVLRLRGIPSEERLDALAERWRPWRAVAARILWHAYLSTPRRRARPVTVIGR